MLYKESNRLSAVRAASSFQPIESSHKMKSKSEIPNKTDYMKYSAFNFIENEKAYSEREKLPPEFASREQNASVLSRSHDVSARAPVGKETGENSSKELRQITDVRIEPGVFAPKRYVSTCYLKCYLQPFWYSETMFITIGASKKRHEEHVMFKSKLMPAHWSETMTTIVGDTKVCSAEIQIPVEDSGYHYLNLVPQQIAAGFEETVTRI